MANLTMAYLDANATEPLRPQAAEAMRAAQTHVGNPSSIHAAGRTARRTLEDARETLAALFGARPEDVVFTSGGTEADALALAAAQHHIIGATEHDAVRTAAPHATILPVDTDGRADLEALATLLMQTQVGAKTGVMVSLMLANNETGAIHPVQAAAALCRHYGAWLHVDAVQAAGRLPLSLTTIGATSLAISSHKLGGPAGAGALLLGPEAPLLAPIFAGGGQERGRRGGTQPVSLIAGFAAAASAARATLEATITALAHLRDRAEAAAIAAGAIPCGPKTERLANTTCLALPGVRADTQVMALDLAGIAVSAGAACSSGKIAHSHVLAAMGLGPLAGQAIRVSLPWNATDADIDAFAAAYTDMARRCYNQRALKTPQPQNPAEPARPQPLRHVAHSIHATLL
jgi:cysteine desulfurase